MRRFNRFVRPASDVRSESMWRIPGAPTSPRCPVHDPHRAVQIEQGGAAEGGQRVAHAAQHLHGGIGVDTSYPLHRYFRWAKQLELSLGAATARLRHFVAMLAERAPEA